MYALSYHGFVITEALGGGFVIHDEEGTPLGRASNCHKARYDIDCGFYSRPRPRLCSALIDIPATIRRLWEIASVDVVRGGRPLAEQRALLASICAEYEILPVYLV